MIGFCRMRVMFRMLTMPVLNFTFFIKEPLVMPAYVLFALAAISYAFFWDA
jgi:hypothetical protein